MKHYIKEIGLFATPESLEALQSQMRGFDMNMGMGLTWNYLASQINEPEPETWFTSNWDEHPEFPVADWKYEIDNDDTRQSYQDWVQDQIDDQS